MDASIIVCTYNRAESLRETIVALRAQCSPPSLNWEVIIVDNNSNDHTRKLVQEAQCDWPLLRYEFEGKQGLSHARNYGIGCALGEVLLFTDDDVLPEPDWLEKTLAGLEKYGADACGGFIAPIWESPPPAWLTARFDGFLAIRTDRSDDYIITEPSQVPFGANMAFKKTVFDQVGLFDVSRGRKGNVLAGGEEIDLFERVLAAGLRAAFLGSSRVHHKIEAYRCTKKYLRRWRFQGSKNLAIVNGAPGNRRIFNIPLYLFPQLARATMSALTSHFTAPADEAFSREMIVCHFAGTIQGLFSGRSGSGHD